MWLKELKNKKLVILGFGKEGKDTFFALRKLFPQKIIGIADEKEMKRPDKRTKMHCGRGYLKALKDYDLIFKTPGIPKSKIKPFLKKGAKITSQTEVFFDNFPGLIIGVTGTKGKGTTSSLIYQILKKAGFKVRLGGNIGKPVFQVLLKSKPDEILICELSSHQLQMLKKSPQIAVFLNLFPDHLDYYKNFKEYQKAKENITSHQTENDFLVYNVDNKKVAATAKKTKAQKITFGGENLKGEWVIVNKERIIKKTALPLAGEFNALNVAAAISTVKLLGVSNKIIREVIRSFRGLPHRLEFVGKYKGIGFYDDSMSTLPEVTIAALNAFGDKVKTLIIGGSEKGSNYTELAEEILKKKVKTLIILSPGTGKKVWQKIKKLKKTPQVEPFFVESMKEAVKRAFKETERGKVCLLSPGAASFNLFLDYKDRGRQFKKWVKYYGQNKNS